MAVPCIPLQVVLQKLGINTRLHEALTLVRHAAGVHARPITQGHSAGTAAVAEDSAAGAEAPSSGAIGCNARALCSDLLRTILQHH